jgi:hypothetical protein
MRESKKQISLAPSCGCYGAIALAALAACLVLSVAVAGQDLPAIISNPVPQLNALTVRQKARLSSTYVGRTGDPQQSGTSSTVILGAAYSEPVTTSTGARLITLQEAQQKAAPAGSNPMVRLGQLQVEVARQTRLGTQSSFFPQIGSAFDNLHFNKFMGEQLQVRRPIQGGTVTIGVPLVLISAKSVSRQSRTAAVR